MVSVNVRARLTRNRYKGSLGGRTSVLPMAAAMIKMISMDILHMNCTIILDYVQHKKTASTILKDSPDIVPATSVNSECQELLLALLQQNKEMI